MIHFEYRIVVLGNTVFFQILEQSRDVTNFFYDERRYDFQNGQIFTIQSDYILYTTALYIDKIYVRSHDCDTPYLLLSRQFPSSAKAEKYYEIVSKAITEILNEFKCWLYHV